MVHDWGSRDAAFLKINTEVLARLPEVVNGGCRVRHRADAGLGYVRGRGDAHDLRAAERQGAAADQRRLWAAREENSRHREAQGRRCTRRPKIRRPISARSERLLKEDATITHIFTIHCETTSGILNPIVALGALAQKYGKSYLIDSMSAFGALPLDASAIMPDAIAASSNKCIEGVPGLGFVIARKAALEKTAGNATTLVLDLHDQWRNFEKTGQYRFTPPIHVIVSFHQALMEFFEEGGQVGRGKRYSENCRVLIDGMRALGFETLLG